MRTLKGDRWVALLLAGVTVGCGGEGVPATPAPPGEPAAPHVSPAPDLLREDALVPPGFGTLRQDDITLTLQAGDLLVKATPLEESVIRLTAPDTYQRLSGLAHTHRDRLLARSGAREVTLFLVSFFSYQPSVVFQPEDLTVVTEGIRLRPAAVQGMTPGWGSQRLGQQETQLAVYAFPTRVDFDTGLVAEYGTARHDGWDRLIPLLQAERAKIRARATGVEGGGGS